MAPLTARGHQQATAAARLLADERITAVYASTALRARQTAEHLAPAVTALAELVEMGIGAHEGSSDAAAHALTAEVLRARIVDQGLGRRVAGGESGHEVVARVTAAFQGIAGSHVGETVAVVGHVASLTVTLARLCSLGARVWGTPLAHAEPFLVGWDTEAWHCRAWPGARASSSE